MTAGSATSALTRSPSTAVRAEGDVELEDSFQPLGPGERRDGRATLIDRLLQLPFPADVENILARTLEIDELDVAVALFALFVALPFAMRPGEHVAIALDSGRDRLQLFEHLRDVVGRHPRIELASAASSSSRSIMPASPPRFCLATSGVIGVQPIPTA